MCYRGELKQQLIHWRDFGVSGSITDQQASLKILYMFPSYSKLQTNEQRRSRQKERKTNTTRPQLHCHAKLGSVFGSPQSVLRLQIRPLVNTDCHYHNRQAWLLPLVCNQLNQGLFMRGRQEWVHITLQDYFL